LPRMKEQIKKLGKMKGKNDAQSAQLKRLEKLQEGTTAWNKKSPNQQRFLLLQRIVSVMASKGEQAAKMYEQLEQQGKELKARFDEADKRRAVNADEENEDRNDKAEKRYALLNKALVAAAAAAAAAQTKADAKDVLSAADRALAAAEHALTAAERVEQKKERVEQKQERVETKKERGLQAEHRRQAEAGRERAEARGAAMANGIEKILEHQVSEAERGKAEEEARGVAASRPRCRR
jgi:hypothetical protein